MLKAGRQWQWLATWLTHGRKGEGELTLADLRMLVASGRAVRARTGQIRLCIERLTPDRRVGAEGSKVVGL